MFCCAAAIAGCTSAGDERATVESPQPTSAASTTVAPTTDVPASTVAENPDESVEPGVIPDLGGLGYECFGQLPFTDLFVLDDRPSLTSEEFASLEGEVELGDADDWISFPNGIRMHREPLTDSAPRAMAVVPPGASLPTTCHPQWLTFYDQVAFQVVAQPAPDQLPVIAIEKCRQPTEIEVGVRVFDDAAVLWLWTREPGEVCEVDGSVTMEVDVPPGLDQVLSGQRWPFGPPLLASWFHYRSAFPGGLDSVGFAPTGIECWSVWNPTNTLITWSGRTADVSIFVDSDDGEFSSQSLAFQEPDPADVEASRAHNALTSWLDELGNPSDLEIAPPVGMLVGGGGGLVDESATGRDGRTYSITAVRGGEDATVSCTPGSAAE